MPGRLLWYLGNVGLERKWIALAAAALGTAACGGNMEHPPQIYPDGSTLTGGGPWPDGGLTEDSGGFEAGVDSGQGASSLFQLCYSAVQMQEEGTHGTPADPYFCFATTPTNPAENSAARNFLTPLVAVSLNLDATDRSLETRASAYWAVTVTAPDFQMLAPGVAYSTANNDGTAIQFRWDKGDCGSLPESGSFYFHVFEYDVTTNVVTTAALDFTDQCGDLGPLYGRVRLHSKLPP
jgi:hypothetical protein